MPTFVAAAAAAAAAAATDRDTMTRPSSASFAQFFPAAPRAARDRAMEREKEKAKRELQESPSSTLTDKPVYGRQSVPSATIPSDDHAVATSTRDPSISDPAQTPADDIDILRADIPNTVGSESSNTSNASSMRVNAAATSKNSSSYSYITPLTTIDSPSPPVGPQPTRPDTSNSSYPAKTNGSALNPAALRTNGDASATFNTSHRIPARDPSLRVQVIKAVHDPSADRSSRDKKKPKYKEFGLVRKYKYIYIYTLGPAWGASSSVFVVKRANKIAVYRKMTLPHRPILDSQKVVASTTLMSIITFPSLACARRHTT